MGIGALWVRRKIRDAMPPFQAGSNMVHEVGWSPLRHASRKVHPNLKQERQRSGRGWAGCGGSSDREFALPFTFPRPDKTCSVNSCSRVHNSLKSRERISVFSFVFENRKPLEIAASLGRGNCNTCRRPGVAASFEEIRCDGAARASCYIYTSTEDIDQLIAGLQQLGSS